MTERDDEGHEVDCLRNVPEMPCTCANVVSPKHNDNLILQGAADRRLQQIVNAYRPEIHGEVLAAINQYRTATNRCMTDLQQRTNEQ